MQFQQARLSTRGRVIQVDAGHAVFRERPDVVVAVVREMIEAAGMR